MQRGSVLQWTENDGHWVNVVVMGGDIGGGCIVVVALWVGNNDDVD